MPAKTVDRLEAIRSQIANNPRAPLVEVLAEMHDQRPGKQSLKRAAKDKPLEYLRTMRQLAEPMIPKEVHSTHTEVAAGDLLAEMRSRGLVDDQSHNTLARSLGAQEAIEGHAEPVEGDDTGDS